MPALQFKIAKAGLKSFQQVGAFIKPTTRMIQIFGHKAKKGKIDIDRSQLSRLLGGEELSLDVNIKKGYVILTYGGSHILGLGFFIKGRLRSQIPRKELRQAMIREVSDVDKKTVG